MKLFLLTVFSFLVFTSCLDDEAFSLEKPHENNLDQYIFDSMEIYSQYSTDFETVVLRNKNILTYQVAFFCGEDCSSREIFEIRVNEELRSAILLNHTIERYNFDLSSGSTDQLIREFEVADFQLFQFSELANQVSPIYLIAGENQGRKFQFEFE